ncbi:P-type ATPase subfamily IV [Trinorchestia longiramus]|nr:P-type ATPase subfamily IV [Trinorchestia longiramus]
MKLPCVKETVPETERKIKVNDEEYNRAFKYANNFIKTSKYNFVTFLPINLYEQFTRLANFYFLCLLLLQLVPVISSLNPITTILPLLGVLSITAIKDAYDDIQRHRSDNQVNNRVSEVLREGQLQEVLWKNVVVGDIIKMSSNQFVAADLLLLSTSDANGLCYVETSELDGETNLKCKQCLGDTSALQDNIEAISSFDAEIQCEPPNNNLSKFQGTLTWRGKNVTLADGYKFQVFLPWVDVIPQEPVASGAAVTAALVFFSYIILLNTVVPISLYVSVEMIRLFQSLLINWDKKMMYKPSKTYAKARTTTLNEELGQVQYIFSDKTGTLTQNVMTFNKCSINGVSYGDVDEELEGYDDPIDFSGNPYSEPSFVFYDRQLTVDLRKHDPNVENFFLLLSLCHTIMPEEEDGKLVYQAQSPDEAALVSAARNFGFVFKSRTPTSITVVINGEEQTHELLCILDFNNVRKRMSVVVRYCGKLRLYCKGADSIIYQRLASGQEEKMATTSEHMDNYAGEGLRTLCLAVKDLDEDYYADWWNRYQEAATSLEERDEKVDAIYEEIEKDLTLLGASAIEDKLQDGVPETIANLALAGIKIWVLTGDKQETAINIGYSCQVTKASRRPPSIFAIRAWLPSFLQLLTDEMHEPIIIDGETEDVVRSQLQKALAEFPDDPADNLQQKPPPKRARNGMVETGYSLVVNGHSLVFALQKEMEECLLAVASQCRAVICCRVTPLQKAKVVDLVKRYKQAVTLSIGDGANDVSMIKTAHIGVGISGHEGMQAVLASDFSVAQFRYLERLLLVHGRWSYYRMCKFLTYFFYKNFAFAFCHFWYAFFVGFSAQTVFDTLFISAYNLFYTALPVLALGSFDQDVSEENSLRYPKLYTPGLENRWFSKKIFLRSALHGILTSCVLFFVVVGYYYNAITPEGLTNSDFFTFGSVLATILVIVVTAQICLDTAYWTIFNHITIWGSLLFMYALQYLVNHAFNGIYLNSLAMPMGEPAYYLCSLLAVVMVIVPVIAWRFWWLDIHPTLTERVRYKQRAEASGVSPKPISLPRIFRRRSTIRRRETGKSLRSGYAFSHQEGFGRLITEGKLLGVSHSM